MRFIPETKTKIRAIGAGLILAVFAISTASAQTTESQRDALQKKLAALQQQINSYQNQIAGTRKQAASLKNEISIYDNEITALELQIQANETLTEDTNLQINELQTQIDRRKVEIEENKKILAQLIVQLSQLDDVSFLNISMGNDNFSSFLDQIQYTQSVQSQVYSLVQKIKEVKAKLEQQQEELKKQLEKLKQLAEELEIQQTALGTQRSQKQKLLDQTRGVEKNYQKLLTASQGEEDKIFQEIQELEDSARAKSGSKTINPTKGVLSWPMDGVLTQGYGNTGFTSLGYSFHSGIDVAAPAGKPIYAPADGVVANCDTGEAAYGNWCTVRHTIETKSGKRNIVTLYGHMRSYKVKPGQRVATGDLIGYEGNTGNTTRLLYGPERGYHLHFMVMDADGYGVAAGKNTAVYGHYSVPYGVTYNPLNFLGSR